MNRQEKTRVLFRVAVFAILLVATGVLWSAGEVDQRWGKIAFQTPFPFSKPEKIGMDAVALVAPPAAGLGKGKIEITLATFSKEMKASSGLKDDELAGYFKSTFLGLSSKAERTVQRTFLGRSITGDVGRTSIPKKTVVESYLIPCQGGGTLGIAVSLDALLSAGELERVVALIAATLREE